MLTALEVLTIFLLVSGSQEHSDQFDFIFQEAEPKLSFSILSF